jgi:hypothetical protein
VGELAKGEGRRAKGEGQRAKGEGRRAKGEERGARGEGLQMMQSFALFLFRGLGKPAI